MRLSHMETSFWYGCALRVAGVPAGAVYAAIRMMQWADFRHGFAVSYFERSRSTMNTDSAGLTLLDEHIIDARGLTSLIAGPLLLDRATVLAKKNGRATVTAKNVGECGWLGQLVWLATRRGFAATLSFIGEGEDARVLSDVYSGARTIVGLPGEEAPWWIESSTAYVDFVEKQRQAEPGVTLTLVDPARHLTHTDAVRAAAVELDLAMIAPETLAQADRAKMRKGWEVDDAEWRSLAEFSFGVLAESTEKSLRSAGA